jgi:PEP-CTERM motif
MNKALMLATVLALCLGLSGVAKADTCPVASTNCLASGGVTYTFTNTTDASDPAGTFDISMTISGNTTSAPATLSSFAVQFGVSGADASNVTLESAPAGTGTWTFAGHHSNDASGCNPSSNAASKWCFNGGSISLPAAGTFTFVFDVTASGAPGFADIQTLQGTELSISNSTGVGSKPPTVTPEPASMLLLGLGLAGVPFLRRRK